MTAGALLNIPKHDAPDAALPAVSQVLQLLPCQDFTCTAIAIGASRNRCA